MTKDMTEGNVLGLILRFALPLLVGNLLQQTYSGHCRPFSGHAGFGRCWCYQQCSVSGVGFLYRTLQRLWCAGGQRFRCQSIWAYEKRHFSWCFVDSGDCSHPDNRLCTSLSMDSQDAVCNGGYLRQRSYLHIDYFPWTAIYTFVQLPVKHSACGWGQQNAVFVSGLFSLFECGIGSDLYHRI